MEQGLAEKTIPKDAQKQTSIMVRLRVVRSCWVVPQQLCFVASCLRVSKNAAAQLGCGQAHAAAAGCVRQCTACRLILLHVPHSPTAAQVGATAGLRLLPDGKADEILAEVRTWLRKHPFKVRAKAWGCTAVRLGG